MHAALPEPQVRRRLLLLAPYPPRADAPHGGGQVMAHLIAGLAERHEVALLCLRGEEDEEIEPRLRERCQIAEELPRAGPRRSPDLRARIGKHVHALAALTTMRPKWVQYCAVPALTARVRSLVPAWRPEVVQAEYHVMGQYLAAVDDPRVRRVLNQHEPGAAAARERWRSGRPGSCWLSTRRTRGSSTAARYCPMT